MSSRRKAYSDHLTCTPIVSIAGPQQAPPPKDATEREGHTRRWPLKTMMGGDALA
ncbi:hypothetical protein [Mycolicibacterium helvum]|uniref:hypothetical protein n=1 Tax=Mycolicibacterium helvum TaxID=1534349 RepID=UPI0013D1769A|nr:hypothetical protein [Mycolicibacterium helvum]